MSEVLDPNSNITVSKEEKITIAQETGTGVGLNKKPLITVQTETEILEMIGKHCNKWNQISVAYNVCIIVFGISAISTSVLVSIYTGQNEIISVKFIKILACISTISLSILTAFNLVSNANNARTAWRSLNAAMMMYKAGSMSIQQLIEQYQKGESQMGNLSFNYGTNSDKPATYSHDIQGKGKENALIQEERRTAVNASALKNSESKAAKAATELRDPNMQIAGAGERQE